MPDIAETIEAVFLDLLRLAGKETLVPRDEIGRTPLKVFDLDSLDTFEFLMQVEEALDLVLDERRASECTCVDELVSLATELKQGSA